MACGTRCHGHLGRPNGVWHQVPRASWEAKWHVLPGATGILRPEWHVAPGAMGTLEAKWHVAPGATGILGKQEAILEEHFPLILLLILILTLYQNCIRSESYRYQIALVLWSSQYSSIIGSVERSRMMRHCRNQSDA